LAEAEAFHLGIRLERLKAAIVFLVAMAVGAGVAAAGVISFVGIVAPHAVRLLVGPDRSCRSALLWGRSSWPAPTSSPARWLRPRKCRLEF
jgi:ABC-type Fe3+-siderophore transport system permease subunit